MKNNKQWKGAEEKVVVVSLVDRIAEVGWEGHLGKNVSNRERSKAVRHKKNKELISAKKAWAECVHQGDGKEQAEGQKRLGERWIVLGLGYQRLTPRETPGRLEQRKEMALIPVSLTQPSVIWEELSRSNWHVGISFWLLVKEHSPSPTYRQIGPGLYKETSWTWVCLWLSQQVAVPHGFLPLSSCMSSCPDFPQGQTAN